MAELTSQERLQPSLLDRLTDADPRSAKESIDARVLTRQQLRAAVLRDLSWLFNTTRLEPSRVSGTANDPALKVQQRLWREMSHARRSVVNYGLPSLSGETVGRLDFPAVEAAVRQAIIDFEPRIDPATLSVEIHIEGGMRNHHNMLRLMIRGHMWNQPVPLELLLAADVDVETGMAAVRDLRG